MSDELTVRIAEVLAAHHDVRTAGFGRWSECSCSPRALLESEFTAHQAEQVRAVLGETTTEWGVRYPGGGIVETYDHDPAEQVSAGRQAGLDMARVARSATPWTEVPS